MRTAELSDPRQFSTDDGSTYQRFPASHFPDGDAWDSVVVEAERLTREASASRIRSLVSVTSQNGWKANDRALIASYTVPGTKTRIALRSGDCSVLLLDFLAWWNVEIEPLDGDVLDDWGYAERLIRGSATELSNHASGTAADADALKHPLGSRTLTKLQLAKIRARIALYRGALRHGAFYTGRPDEMHVEVNAGPALVRAVADDIRAGRLAAGTSGGPGTPIAPIEEDFLSGLTDEEQREVRDNLRLVKLWLRGPEDASPVDRITSILDDTNEVQQRVRGNTARDFDMLQSIEGLASSTQRTLVGSHTDGADRLTDLWVAILGRQPEPADASAVAAMIPDSIAEQVVALIAKRLAS